MSYSKIVFPELEKELQRNPQLLNKKNTQGIFEIVILVKGKPHSTYYIVLDPNRPFVSRQKPTTTGISNDKFVHVEIEDKDMLKMISGGMNGVKAYTNGLLKISGDLVLAREAEKIFIKAGGVEKVMKYIKQNYPKSSKL